MFGCPSNLLSQQIYRARLRKTILSMAVCTALKQCNQHALLENTLSIGIRRKTNEFSIKLREHNINTNEQNRNRINKSHIY